MKNINQRIQSVLNAQNIGVSIDGIADFFMSDLQGINLETSNYPKSLRLGKQVEKIVSALIQSSTNYEIVKENIQIFDGKITIGELDFIIKNLETNEIFHLELVYKFYVYGPNNSEIELEKWIGPNRKDSFIEKFKKLKNKQFPLLYKPQTHAYLEGIKVDEQKLCFLAYLFVPYKMYGNQFLKINNAAIIGYWVTLNEFETLKGNEFYLPQKKEWGISPSYDNNWESYVDVLKQIIDFHSRNFSPLCWVKKQDNMFEQCFIVWWK